MHQLEKGFIDPLQQKEYQNRHANISKIYIFLIFWSTLFFFMQILHCKFEQRDAAKYPPDKLKETHVALVGVRAVDNHLISSV